MQATWLLPLREGVNSNSHFAGGLLAILLAVVCAKINQSSSPGH